MKIDVSKLMNYQMPKNYISGNKKIKLGVRNTCKTIKVSVVKEKSSTLLEIKDKKTIDYIKDGSFSHIVFLGGMLYLNPPGVNVPDLFVKISTSRVEFQEENGKYSNFFKAKIQAKSLGQNH